MALPQCVIDARKIDFGIQITGYLCCAEFEPPCVVGVVFCETRGRFVDGIYVLLGRGVRKKGSARTVMDIGR